MFLNEQDSECTLGLKYGKVLNMAGFSICERSLHNVLDIPEHALTELGI